MTLVQLHMIRSRRRGLVAALPLVSLILASCLGEPEIDQRWTLLEMVESTPQPTNSVVAGGTVDVTVSGRITYRKILTGFLVAEVRYSDSVTPSSVTLDPTRHTLDVAQDVDRILANSVTAGRATKPVTGFDHLLQDVGLSFTAQLPDTADGGGVYLLLYMGEGDEIRLQDGRDSLVVTPFVSTDREVLHTGFALSVSQPGGGGP